MAQFATVSDLASWLGTTIPNGDARATLLLQMASAAVQNRARQRLEFVAGDVVTLPGTYSDALVLPERPVTAVSAVVIDGVALASTAYAWTRLGRLWRVDGGSWGSPKTAVAVTYSHGFATIPDDIRGVCLSAAARAYENPAAVQAESVASYSVTHGAEARGVALTGTERDVVDRYRRRTASVPVLAE